MGSLSIRRLVVLGALAPGVAAAQPGDCAGAGAGADPGLSLPPGFCASVFADNIGHARHIAVAPNGVVYVNSWRGQRHGSAEPPPDAGFVIALQDRDGDGKAETVKRFGETPADGGAGGTGVAVYDGGLYVEAGDRILRYDLPSDDIAPRDKPQIIVSGLPLSGDHPMHPFGISATGALYLDSGSATNACQAQNRMRESPGLTPCRELETRAGVWRFDAKTANQKFSSETRFATGIRNGEGIAIDGDRVYVTQHGRDQLSENWPTLYKPAQGPELPAEELFLLMQGADYGWPECYYDGAQRKLVLAPEYGGDGGKAVGVCARKQGPVAAFPAHWGPNAAVVYHGASFPKAYDGGLFIAFHGSWNRAPAPQAGYNVVFQPMRDGQPQGDYSVFADGFAGRIKEPGAAAHRPSGVAVGPDGALYVSDDIGGRIWRVTFHGDVVTTGVSAARGATQGAGTAAEATHPDAGKSEGRRLPVPPERTDAQVTRGARIFNGSELNGSCAGCHGANGEGSPLAPDLTTGKWLWADGGLASIESVILNGVAQPKSYRSPMPAKGGATLNESDVTDVAAYVWAISRAR